MYDLYCIESFPAFYNYYLLIVNMILVHNDIFFKDIIGISCEIGNRGIKGGTSWVALSIEIRLGGYRVGHRADLNNIN